MWSIETDNFLLLKNNWENPKARECVMINRRGASNIQLTYKQVYNTCIHYPSGKQKDQAKRRKTDIYARKQKNETNKCWIERVYVLSRMSFKFHLVVSSLGEQTLVIMIKSWERMIFIEWESI